MTILVAGLAFVALVVFVVFGAMKSSEAYKGAFAKAAADPAVVEALGTPIIDGWLVSGNTNVNGASGTADLSFPISGPKGSGTVYLVATKSAGTWTYTTLEVEIAGGDERIKLLSGKLKTEN